MSSQTPRSFPSFPARLPLRPLLAAVLILAALAYAMPLAATRIIGQEVLRAHAQAALAAALDRAVDISGEVRLTLVPWFGLRTGPMTIPNEPGFGPEPILSVESATIGLDISALATRRIVVDSIALAQADLRLGRDETGRENWIIEPPGAGSLPQAPSGWKVESLPTGLRLLNATLSYADRVTGQTLEVRRLNLNTSSSRPFDFSVSCELAVAPLGLAGELHAQGVGSYGAGGSHVQVHTSEVAGWLSMPPAKGQPAERVNMTAKVMVHGEAGAFEVANLALEGLGARVTGQVNAAGLYDGQPYLHLNLAAKASRSGAWAGLLGLAPFRPAPLPRADAAPSLTLPPPAETLDAELVVSSTPSGWLASRILLRDGPGWLEGTARDIGGNVFFDLTASGLDIGPWLSAAPLLRLAEASGSSFASVKGRFSGSALQLGELDILDMEVSARGEHGALRLYPFTARTHLALLTSDIRLKPGGSSSTFAGTARVQGLPAETSPQNGHGPQVTIAEASLSGEAGATGVSGKATAKITDFSKRFKPAWLSEEILKAWELLGGGNAAASFALHSGPGAGWELADIDAKIFGSRVTGRMAGTSGASGAADASAKGRRTTLDLQADRLEFERLRQLAAIFAGPDPGKGFAPWPVDATIAAKRFVAQNNLEIDDLQASVQASPEALKVSSVSGQALGGRFSGGMDLEDQAGRRTLSANLSLSGVSSSHLRQFWPDFPKSSGSLEGRLGLDASAQDGAPLWQALRGQAELQHGQGSFTFSPEQADSRPWPVSRASASLRFTTKAAPPPAGGEKNREAALADVAGTLRVDSPGVVRSTQVDIKGQGGLDAAGKPLWFRQPRIEGAHALVLPFTSTGKPVRAAWAGRLDVDMEKGGFSFTGLDINLGGILGRASLSGQPSQGATALAGTLDIPEFDPREAAPRLGLAVPEKADPALWRRAKVSAEIGGSLKEVRLNRLLASLDDSSITGQASVSGPKTRLDLSVNSLDLDRLAPSAPPHPDPAKRPETPLPLAELRELSLDAKVRLGRLVRDKLVWENSLTEFTAQGGRFQLRQSAPSFYGGPYSLEVKGDARGQEMKAHLELKLAGFSATDLLRALAGGTSLSRGVTNFYLNVDTHGSTDRALRRNADGKAGFEVLGGKMAVREASGRRQEQTQAPGLSAGREEAAPAPPPSDGLSFTRMGADFSVRGGLAVTRDFVLVGTGITAKGDGWVNLDDERIDLYLSANVPDVGDIPVRISGDLYDPHMDIDKSKILGDTIVNIFKGVFSIPGEVLNQLRRVF